MILNPFVIIAVTFLLAVIIFGFSKMIGSKIEGYANAVDEFRKEGAYLRQIKLLADKYDGQASKRRPVTDLLADQALAPPEIEQCLVNFYSLGCRFTGYVGPFNNGYFDPEPAITYACKAGCRTFILEIDYMDDCVSEGYFPKIVVRDVQSKNQVTMSSSKPMCNSIGHSNIKEVSEAINRNAFAKHMQNSTDPVIIVLYFLRMPPSASVLEYFSNVAKGLGPLLNRHVDNLVNGGTFTRQKQEGTLLINSITDYEGRVLIFSNADTSIFRDSAKKYQPKEDLDYLVNLRLTYRQTKMGCTAGVTSGVYGVLEAAEDYLIIPPDQTVSTQQEIKLRWTCLLSSDPSMPVTEDTFNKVTDTYGCHCIPITLWDEKNKFMFSDKRFGKYSFIPKPVDLRYRKPMVAVPGEPSVETDAKSGKLRTPALGLGSSGSK